MSPPTKEARISAAIETRRADRFDICPSTIAFELGMNAKEITAYLRTQDDLYLKRKAHARRPSTRAYQQCCSPMYFPSIWGFREIEA